MEFKYVLVEDERDLRHAKVYGRTKFEGKILAKVVIDALIDGQEISADEIRSVTHPQRKQSLGGKGK